MRSSTSSSDVLNAEAVVPPGRWGFTWLLAIVLFGAMLGGFEVVARTHGHRPSVADDAQLWVHWRSRIYDSRDKTLVLLGGSRLALGFSPDAFRAQFPEYNVVQLSVSGTQPVAALRDLANDDRFRGIVICDVTEASLERRNWESQQYLVASYRAGQPLDFELNLAVSLFVQEHLVIVNPFLNLSKLAVVALTTGTFRGPYHVTGFRDRSQHADFSKIEDMAGFVEAQRQRVRTVFQPPSPRESWLSDVAEVSALADEIQARGGKVVFLYMPLGSTQWEVTDRLYPRSQYWDHFVQRTRAMTIYSRDIPALSDFDVPDEAHLDGRDVDRFTLALIDELVRRGVFARNGGRPPNGEISKFNGLRR